MELPVRTRTDSAAFATKEQQPQQVSAKEPQQQQKRAPRTTFLLLPRELRNQIYGYLLSHEYTKMPPYHTCSEDARGRDLSAAHTYRFHVNILAVNKQINEEAAKELLLRNTFVVVSWRWEELGETLNGFDIPIITENQTAVAKFKNHSFRLHLDCPGERGPVRSLLMLHSDLNAFCRTIRFLGAIVEGPAHFVLQKSESAGGSFGAYSNNCSPAFRTMIRFNRVDANSEEEAVNKKGELLAPLAELHVAGQKLVVLDPEAREAQSDFTKIVDDLTKLAAPSLVWVRVAAWDLLDISLGLMADGNKLCREGDYRRALRHYSSVIIGAPLRHFLCNLPPPVLESDAAPPVIMGLRVQLDAVAAVGWLTLRRGRIGEAVFAQRLGWQIFDLLTDFPSRWEVLMPPNKDPSTWSDRMSFGHFSALCTFFLDDNPLQECVDAFKAFLRQFPDDTYLAHDLEVFLRLSESNRTIALEDRPKLLEKFSVCALPLQPLNFQIPEHNARPTKVSGWHDQEQYEDAAACFKDKLRLGHNLYINFPKQSD
ncbi:hypothetical protein D0869_04436 [Hortaea werneckii]|uniref:Uncharacterized protein n=2 Tax=Hortaea werneckii TaxID=91943 RepID=A0A3M6X2B9_HORWE|nr:hypothetical protein D0869_04436 [Hortaea werneckii]